LGEGDQARHQLSDETVVLELCLFHTILECLGGGGGGRGGGERRKEEVAEKGEVEA